MINWIYSQARSVSGSLASKRQGTTASDEWRGSDGVAVQVREH